MNAQEILLNMYNKISHRGLDKDGLYISNTVSLGHRSIIPEDKQPIQFSFAENNYVIVYDGTLYNSDELKHELEQYDFCFSTNSDAEVILKGYIHFQEK